MTTRVLPSYTQTIMRTAVAVAMACCAGAWAVPATIQYQGYLSNAAGTPVTGVLPIIFRLYAAADAELAPEALWAETHESVPITAGKFTVTLGAASSFEEAGVTFEQPLFLELEISGDILLPRLPLHSVPYALKAAGVVAGGVTAPMLAEGAVGAGKVAVSLAGTGLAVSADGKLRVALDGITAELLADGSVWDRHVAAEAAIDPAKIAGTAVTLADAQTLTNKTLDADQNSLMNVDLDEFRPGVVLTDLTPAAKGPLGVDDQLATAGAIIRFVEATLGQTEGSIGILRLLGILDIGVAGQAVMADGSGGFMLGSTPMSLDPSTEEWGVARVVDAGRGSLPFGVAQDATGKLYVSDVTSHCIRVFSRYGEYLGWYGKSIDNDVANIGFHAGSDSATPVAGAEAGAFNEPVAVAVMAPQVGSGTTKDCPGEGTLWVADFRNNRIQAIDLSLSGTPALVYAGREFFDWYGLVNPDGIAVLGQTLWVSDTYQHRVFEINCADGLFEVLGWYGSDGGSPGRFHFAGMETSDPIPGSGDLQFNLPRHLAVDDGSETGVPVLAVADRGNARVVLIDLASRRMLGWIGADDQGGSGWHSPASEGPLPVAGDGAGAFATPHGVAFGPYGLAVSDSGSNVVQVYTPSTSSIIGVKGLSYDFSCSIGTWGTAPGQFSVPVGLATDLDGALWVCDYGNSRLQKLQPPHVGAYSVVPPESGSVIVGGDIPEASAALQVDSCSGGLLLPRYSDVGQLYDCIANPVEGLLVYSYGTPLQRGKSVTSDQGFYFWNGYDWQRVGALGYGEVTSYNLQDGTITGDDIQDNSIPTSKLQTPNVISVWNGALLQAAIDSIPDAAATNPYLIRVGPGVFFEQVTMKPYVSIEGSGEGTTIVRYSGANGAYPGFTVQGADGTELRSLTVESAAAGRTDGLGVYCAAASFRMHRVSVKATGGSYSNCGIRVNGSTAALVGSYVSSAASGGAVQAAGLYLENGATASLDHAVSGATTTGEVSSSRGIYTDSSALTLRESTVTAIGASSSYGVFAACSGVGTSTTTLVDSEVTASGASASCAYAAPTATNGSVAAAIHNCRLAGLADVGDAAMAIANYGFGSIRVAGSQLTGVVAEGVKMIGCYGSDFDPVP